MADQIVSPVPSRSDVQRDRDIETVVAFLCARAGVAFIGIQCGYGAAPDVALFQPLTSTLGIPVAEFANPERVIELIKAKVVQAGYPK